MNQKIQRKNLIFLAGFMGSGKSTIGPILANALGWEFIDIDKSIEQKASQRIVDIFASGGEKTFRAFESEALRELLLRDECVVSLGGGTLGTDENFELIRQNGIIVYLQLSPDKILQRVRHKTDRPMLKDPSGKLLQGDELQKRIDELLASREEYYSKADIIIPADSLKVGTTVETIVRRLRGLLRS